MDIYGSDQNPLPIFIKLCPGLRKVSLDFPSICIGVMINDRRSQCV